MPLWMPPWRASGSIAPAGIQRGWPMLLGSGRVATGWNGVDASPSPPDHDVARPNDPVLDNALRTNAAGVGRRVAIEQLLAAAERSRHEGAAVVVISGEVGIGKTTLVADFARTLAGQRGWDVYYGRFDEQVAAAFHPLDSVIGRIAERLPAAQMHRHAARHGGDLVRLAPSLAERITAPPATPSDGRTARHLLFEAVTDIAGRAARTNPMVIAVDDLQWAGPAAALLLRHLARHLGQLPILLVATVRATPEKLPDHVRDLVADWSRGHLVRIGLEGLDRADLVELVHDRVSATVGRDVGPVVDALYDEATGNPLFADHLLADWDRSGRLVFDADTVRISRPVDFDVSATLRDLGWQRVSRLGDGAADVITAGAVLGLEFDEAVLAAMPTVDPRSLADLIDRAVAAGVLVDDNDDDDDRSGTVRFAREATSAVRDVDDPDLVLLVFFTAYGAAVCAAEPADARAWSARVHEVAEEVRDPQLRWALGVLDGFEATMAARFEDAARIVAETADLGVQIGAEDATAVFAGQSFMLSTFTGRHAELLPLVEQSLETADVELTFRLAHALICCEIGRHEVGEELLQAVRRGEVDRTPIDFLRSTELLALVVIALELHDLEAAAWLFPQVLPLAGEVSFNSLTSHGPIAAYVGKPASLLGRFDEAETFLRDALATTESFGWEYHRATTLLALSAQAEPEATQAQEHDGVHVDTIRLFVAQ